ncbi:unnamed protein product [Prorocentrum cordatum]|nr:unnamed protein product [Polarella glacialis]
MLRNENVSAALDGLLAWHSAAFPRFAQELQAMAQGAGLGYRDLAAYSFKNELLAVFAEQAPDSEREACSDVLVHDQQSHVHGHNEDGEEQLANFSYIVRTDDFEAMVYPGALAGGAFGFNRHGLVVTMNALSPRSAIIKAGCAGKYWLGRAVLEAESIQQAIGILERFCHAYGMSLNVGSVVTKEQVNIEVAPGGGVSVWNVSGGSYFHANAYLHMNVTEDPHLSPSSAHREARARQLLPAVGRDGVLRVLGDTQDKHWPIYRTLGNGDYSVTLATALFDYDRLRVDIWAGSNPRLAQPLLTRWLLEPPPMEGLGALVV